MGNSQKKGAKTKTNQEEQERENRDEENDDSGSEAEAEVYLDLEVYIQLKNGTTTKHNVSPSWTVRLDHFKEDIQNLMKTNKRIEIYRDNRNDALGPAHLSLRALNIENGTVLSVKEFDN